MKKMILALVAMTVLSACTSLADRNTASESDRVHSHAGDKRNI